MYSVYRLISKFVLDICATSHILQIISLLLHAMWDWKHAVWVAYAYSIYHVSLWAMTWNLTNWLLSTHPDSNQNQNWSGSTPTSWLEKFSWHHKLTPLLGTSDRWVAGTLEIYNRKDAISAQGHILAGMLCSEGAVSGSSVYCPENGSTVSHPVNAYIPNRAAHVPCPTAAHIFLT